MRSVFWSGVRIIVRITRELSLPRAWPGGHPPINGEIIVEQGVGSSNYTSIQVQISICSFNFYVSRMQDAALRERDP